MIGSAKITYTNENVCELVRKDLIDKFGNRELANYNLYLPGVVKPSAKVTTFPTPDVKVTTVEQQIIDLGVLPGQQVPRGPETVSVVAGKIGGVLSSVFDYKARKLVISGGPVPFDAEAVEFPYAAHWYQVQVAFPLGFKFVEHDVLSYSVNGKPYSYVITADDESAGNVKFLLDAKFTTADLLINWNDAYAAEKIAVVCNASLESAAIEKIPAFPTSPKFEFIYPESEVVDSVVQVDVDLDLGKV